MRSRADPSYKNRKNETNGSPQEKNQSFFIKIPKHIESVIEQGFFFFFLGNKTLIE